MTFVMPLLLGFVFGSGLIISGMVNPGVIISGLKVGSHGYDWSLLLTFISALTITVFFYRIGSFMTKPIYAEKFQIPSNSKIDTRLIIGSILFGIGWGLIGLCPGPMVTGLGFIQYHVYWIAFLGLALGYITGRILINKTIKTYQ